MKLFIVENDPLAISSLVRALDEMKWSHYSFPIGKNDVAADENIGRFLRDVCDNRPDVVLLDAALTTKEEKFLDRLQVETMQFSEDKLSGFKFCRALVRERLGIPIVFLTRSIQGQVARTAVRVGADRVLTKHSKNEELLHEVEELVKSRTHHDSAFYWPMRDGLDRADGMWQRESLSKALDRFFLNVSSVRRFGMFTASLRGILSPLFQGDVDAERKLMLGLVKSQMLLSLVDPRLRDHVKHTGNVFWMGYRLLHDIAQCRQPELLAGHIPALYDSSGPLTPREQLLYSWTLAALFHDFGYIDERQDQVVTLISGVLRQATVTYTSVRDEASWGSNMQRLKEFAEGIVGRDHFLYKFLDAIVVSFGSNAERRDGENKRGILVDHGFLSAHRLLDMVPFDKLDSQQKNCVLHAAFAIACHNCAEMVRKWKLRDGCTGEVEFGALPVCSLLAFCDNIQTWDREPEVDPAITRTEAHDQLLERLILSDAAYISGSEISEFSLSNIEGRLPYSLNVKLRYFVEAAAGVANVCESLSVDIKTWIDSGKLRDVCKMMGLSSVLHGEIVYELPMCLKSCKVNF